MANETNDITVGTSAWVQVSLAGQQALVTPVNPGFTYLVRYSTLQPLSSVITGHKFFAKDHIPNAVIGGTNTDNGWMRLLNGADQKIEVTIL